VPVTRLKDVDTTPDEFKCCLVKGNEHIVNGHEKVKCLKCPGLFCAQCANEYLQKDRDEPCPRCQAHPLEFTDEIDDSLNQQLLSTLIYPYEGQ
jgi:hypothetical protein